MVTLSSAQLVCFVTLVLITITAVSASPRYRMFGFSALPTPPTTIVNANDNYSIISSGWISCDLHIGSFVWATDDSSGGTALVNVSLAVATTAGGDNVSAHSFQSVTCNGEWVAMTRVVSNESTTTTVVTFPFMSNPSSCAMRFLWPYCAGWASCDAGMELSWSEHKDASDAVVLGANIAGVTFQHTTIARSTKPSSSSPSVSSFCGAVAGSSSQSGAAEVRHLRVDFLGASNRWLSIANASASLISGGWQAGARNAAACRVRPYSMLRSLRELSLSPRNGLEVEPLDIVIDSTNGLATTWPLNYINVTSSSTAGQLPQCFSQTIAWFAGVVSEPELSLRIFLPTDDLMSLVISSNQSTQYVPLTPCSSNEATPSSATNQQPPWLLPYMINNSSSAPSFISGSFAYCGGYGGTPNVLLDVRNVSKEEGQGSITAVTMFGFVTVSSNGFIAPACPVTMTFNASSSSSAPAGRGDIDALVFVDVTPASQEEGGTNQQPPDCLEWNLANVGRTPWYQLQYHVACDRFWMATSFGAFPLTPCVQWPSTT
ncbi:membrane-associated protein, putative [Bodo saltans]|uniref:Membrane-associated protein, putative n=1 Tax=Bodo saltans TaxID=75058 RepID=A0A0S4J6R4_BODSA|nr:membrane-associated protein, putative [Bodo saltans]|eukprot:CUG87108.1 membrane-associated protein, putative [Bodo saltans]